jgi:hypothetical protein
MHRLLVCGHFVEERRRVVPINIRARHLFSVGARYVTRGVKVSTLAEVFVGSAYGDGAYIDELRGADTRFKLLVSPQSTSKQRRGSESW